MASIRNEPVWIEILNASVSASSANFPRLVLCPRRRQTWDDGRTEVGPSSVSVNTAEETLTAAEKVVGADYVLLQNYYRKTAPEELLPTSSFADRRSCFWAEMKPAPSEYVVEWPERNETGSGGGGDDDDVLDVFVIFDFDRSIEVAPQKEEVRRSQGDIIQLLFKNIQSLGHEGKTE